MSSIWYQACKQFGTAPRAVEFERETESFLIRKDGRRDAKETTYSKWFRTEAEALAAIADRIEKEDKKKAMLRVRNAAHDLLEALEHLLEYAESVFEHTPICVKVAHSVIAKAKGL